MKTPAGWQAFSIPDEVRDQGPPGERMRQRIPQRRFGATSDLDGALLLLASAASRYMTGSVVTVDGGFLLT